MISIPEIRGRYTPEMALVILICRVYFKTADGDEIDGYIAQNKIDWGLLEQIIAAHQVRPFIFKVLSGGRFNIPGDFLSRLRNKNLEIARGNMQKLEELVRLHKLFTINGVPYISYKGVVLSQFLFGDYISRETSDIDFLIDKQYFANAHELLVAQGYNPRFYNPDFERQFLNSSQELLYRKSGPSGAIKIELHWEITSMLFDIPLPNKYLFNNTQVLQLAGEHIPVLNMQNHLLVLMVHHGVNDVWRTLRHTIDIAVFLEKYSGEIDWNIFRQATQKFKIDHTTAVGLLIVRQLFGISIPGIYKTSEKVPAGILDNILRFPALEKRKLNIDNLKQQVFLRDSFVDKIRMLCFYIYAGLIPNVRDMEANKVPKGWYFLYYFIKPFRILFKRH